MYQPPAFREDRIEVLHGLIKAHPLATLVCLSEEGLLANHVPLILHADLGDKGTLRGHVARANPIWKTFTPDVDVLAVFQGVEHYITPSWYPAKKEHGKVVPTWNYAVVHAHGPLSVHKDPEWLLSQVESLTTEHEADRQAPWAVSDAPDDFVQRQLRGIIGIEIPIARIDGKWKMSQNRDDADRLGVIEGLEAEATISARTMAGLVPK